MEKLPELGGFFLADRIAAYSMIGYWYMKLSSGCL